MPPSPVQRRFQSAALARQQIVRKAVHVGSGDPHLALAGRLGCGHTLQDVRRRSGSSSDSTSSSSTTGSSPISARIHSASASFERQHGQPLLAARAERVQVDPVQHEREVVAVRADQADTACSISRAATVCCCSRKLAFQAPRRAASVSGSNGGRAIARCCRSLVRRPPARRKMAAGALVDLARASRAAGAESGRRSCTICSVHGSSAAGWLAAFAHLAQHLVALQQDAVVALQRAQVLGRRPASWRVQVLPPTRWRSAGQGDVVGREVHDG